MKTNENRNREFTIEDKNGLAEAIKLISGLDDLEYEAFDYIYGEHSFKDLQELKNAIDKIKLKLQISLLQDKIRQINENNSSKEEIKQEVKEEVKEENNYVVYVSGGKTPVKAHTLENAKSEAKRLAMLEKKDTFVFKKECMYKIDVKEIKF